MKDSNVGETPFHTQKKKFGPKKPKERNHPVTQGEPKKTIGPGKVEGKKKKIDPRGKEGKGKGPPAPVNPLPHRKEKGGDPIERIQKTSRKTRENSTGNNHPKEKKR